MRFGRTTLIVRRGGFVRKRTFKNPLERPAIMARLRNGTNDNGTLAVDIKAGSLRRRENLDGIRTSDCNVLGDAIRTTNLKTANFLGAPMHRDPPRVPPLPLHCCVYTVPPRSKAGFKRLTVEKTV